MASNTNESASIYSVGRIFELWSHIPPLPFGHLAYKENAPQPYPPAPTETENQVEYVFRNHPIRTELPKNQQSLSITISRQLSSDKEGGPQTLVCLANGRVSEPRFAKIYDAMYYTWDDHRPGRVVLQADRDYSREAAAYSFLDDRGLNGKLGPVYYGSWTTCIMDNRGRKRYVRLILTEYVPAPSLWQEYYLKPKSRYDQRERIPPNERTDMPQSFERFRLKVYKAFLEIKAGQSHAGLKQRDLAPRNVLAVLDNSAEQDMERRLKRVVVVDYNVSIVLPLSNMDFSPRKLPTNPMEVHWNGWMPDYHDWVPKTWHQNNELHREWLYKEFGSEKSQGRYEPFLKQFSQDLQRWLQAREKKA